MNIRKLSIQTDKDELANKTTCKVTTVLAYDFQVLSNIFIYFPEVEK